MIFGLCRYQTVCAWITISLALKENILVRQLSLYSMSILYTLAGVNHFWHKTIYLTLMPTWLGYHEMLVLLSGAFEVLLGLLLLPLRTRRVTAWGIVLLLLAVFPTNVQMMLNYLHTQQPYAWLTIARLPLQGLLIWWAYGFTKTNKV
jgi:uncharacterized membrane protein